MIQMSFFNPLILSSSVLKPYLYLCFRKSQRFGQFTSSSSADVFVPLVFDLQSESLFAAECSSLPSWSTFLASSPGHCNN